MKKNRIQITCELKYENKISILKDLQEIKKIIFVISRYYIINKRYILSSLFHTFHLHFHITCVTEKECGSESHFHPF